MTLAIRLNNRVALVKEFTDRDIPRVAQIIREHMDELRTFQRVLITATRENVTRIVYSH